MALAVGSRPPGVTWHPALWSPDFPPLAPLARPSSDCPADSHGQNSMERQAQDRPTPPLTQEWVFLTNAGLRRIPPRKGENRGYQ